jgi:hypothetical protein
VDDKRKRFQMLAIPHLDATRALQLRCAHWTL